MKKILLILICGTLVLYTTDAQPEQRRKGGAEGSIAESLKIAYITKQLNLTTSEAEKFWPVYNAYIAEIKKAKKENLLAPDPLILEEQVLNIRKKYKDNFRKILGSEERANKLFVAENEFGKMIRKEWQNRMQHRNKPNDNNSGEKDVAPPPSGN